MEGVGNVIIDCGLPFFQVKEIALEISQNASKRKVVLTSVSPQEKNWRKSTRNYGWLYGKAINTRK